jgi:hypothetical protein
MKVAKLNHQISFLTNSIDFKTLIVKIFVLVDDWYQKEGKALKCKSPGSVATTEDKLVIYFSY